MDCAWIRSCQLAAQGAMIERLSSDSRRCAPGVAFLAYPGEKADGRAHIGDAIARGAAAVLWEAADSPGDARWRVPNLAVRGPEAARRRARARVLRPSVRIAVGVRRDRHQRQDVLQPVDRRGARPPWHQAGVIGTLGAGFPGALAPLVNTTPDALEIAVPAEEFPGSGRKGGRRWKFLRTAWSQGRVNGVRFACALFTNLSHDHLDYHGSMQAYGEAKARLFESPGSHARC